MEHIFLSVLNHALTISALILVIMLTRFLFRKMPKWLTCILWSVVAFRLVFPIPIISRFSVIPSDSPISVGIAQEEDTQIFTGIEGVDGLVLPMLPLPFSPDEPVRVNPLQSCLMLGALVWLIGAAVLQIYAAATYLSLKRRVRASVRCEEKVYECDDISGPFVLGIIKPRIYLPSGLSEQAKGCVLKHERAHLQRKDYIWKLFGYLILSVYWFQPLCWVAYILFCRDVEYACDEKATANESNRERAEYCQVLLACSLPGRRITAYPIAFGENGVKGRVKNIMKHKKTTFGITAVSVVLCIIIAVCFATSQKPQPAEKRPAEKSVNVYVLQGSEPDHAKDYVLKGQDFDTGWVEKINTQKYEINVPEKDSGTAVWNMKYDFDDFYVEPRGYVFDGTLLYFMYDIVNTDDISAVLINPVNEGAQVNYYNNGQNSKECSIVWAIVKFEEEQESCTIEICAKESEKKYSCSLVVNETEKIVSKED